MDRKTWEDHLKRLNDAINMENRLLKSKRRQADRTGDHEGFAAEIRSIEEKIENLECQVTVTQGNVEIANTKISELINEMRRAGCGGVA